MLESIQKLLPWVTGLPIAPKIAVTIIWLLLSFVFLYMVWVPVAKVAIDQRPAVRQAYDRMERVLSQIKLQPDGQIVVNGNAVEHRLAGYYRDYIAIAEFVSKHPGDIKGAYEEIWAHGGAGRVFIDDTQAFEAVVSGFFQQYTVASNGG
ncbi:MAG: hypothetical protein NDI81_05300 [Desulfobacula sp.]|nr:hypothetical protein [Desulfobacula sp.]